MTRSIPRRAFLKTSGLLGVWSALAACGAAPQAKAASTLSGSAPTPRPSPTSALTSPLQGEALLAHTLRRISWGATPEMFERARKIGLEAYLDEQLHPETLDDALLAGLLTRFSTLTMSPAERLQIEPPGRPVQELIAATLLRQRYSARQLVEVMVDFWTNHFNIYIGKNQCRALKTDDDLHVIRPHALGRFADLLDASAHSPAMLVYLDQAESTQAAPNENYARELMELHTISVEAGYSHHDVEEVARGFTGWSVAGPRSRRAAVGTYLFRPEFHDDSEKHVLGQHIPAGGGERDGQAVLALLADHPMTATFVSRKLARRFVADDPPPSLVTALAERFRASGSDIRQVLSDLLRSPEFLASAGQKVKRPLEFFVSALRVTAAELTPEARALGEHLRQLGELPFFWSPPDGYPDYAGWWTTTSGLLNRWNFAMLLTGGQIRGVKVDLHALTRAAASPTDVVDLLGLRFTGESLPEEARAILIDFASQGDLGRNLAAVAGLILGSPAFQVR